jgi:hypothetical protein
MRTKVTESGVNIPKAWLEGIDEVEIQKEHNMIMVVPVQADDPIRALGTVADHPRCGGCLPPP